MGTPQDKSPMRDHFWERVIYKTKIMIHPLCVHLFFHSSATEHKFGLTILGCCIIPPPPSCVIVLTTEPGPHKHL